MALNPYDGSEFSRSWQQGFAAGFLAPEDDHPAPSPLELDQQQVYAEGVLAGSDLANQGISLPDVEPVENAFGEIVADGVHVLDLGHTAVEIAKGTFTVGKAAGGVIFLFATEAIFGPDRSAPYFDEAAEQAFLRVRNALAENTLVTENVEFFMAACDQTSHGTSNGDAMTRQGWWHGKLYLNFDRAAAEAREHEHPDSVRVLRFQTASPDLIDVIEVS